jgi:hypothetical protein
MEQKQKEQLSFEDIERKRLKYIERLSLAERLGLVDRPPLPLSQQEWKVIEDTHLKRTHGNVTE